MSKDILEEVIQTTFLINKKREIYSLHILYHHYLIDGGPYRTRTDHLLNANQALYQMS